MTGAVMNLSPIQSERIACHMPHKILLVGSNPADMAAVKAALSVLATESFRVEWLASGATAVERVDCRRNAAQRSGLAAVLVDLSVGDKEGLYSIEQFCAAVPSVPVVVLCAAKDEAAAKLAVRRGARDYVLKERLDNYWFPKALAAIIAHAQNELKLVTDQQRAKVTLDSIGDAVVSTDARRRVTYLNPVAERLTGWSQATAEGRAVEDVLRIIDGDTRAPADNPLAAAIRQNETVSLTPNCVLVARDGVETAIEDSAAPVRDRSGRVTGAVMVFRDVGSARSHAKRMSYLAHHDSLTELSNRVLLADRLDHAVALSHRNRQKAAVLFVDLDHFKDVNDSLGHAVGDCVLKTVAKRLVARVRGSDTVSRLGGDEFVVVLSELSHARDAAATARKILRLLRKPYHVGPHEVRLTASIGIATYPDDGTDAQTLLTRADEAMYRVKEAGRNDYAKLEPVTAARAADGSASHGTPRQPLGRHPRPVVGASLHRGNRGDPAERPVTVLRGRA